MSNLFKKVFVVTVITILTVNCYADAFKTLKGTVKRNDDRKPGDYFYYIDFNDQYEMIKDDFYNSAKLMNTDIPEDFKSTMEASDKGVGLHASIGSTVKESVKVEDLLGNEYEFYAVSGINIWPSINYKYQDLRIWMIKILIPKDKANEIFENDSDSTLHLSYGYYLVINPYYKVEGLPTK